MVLNTRIDMYPNSISFYNLLISPFKKLNIFIKIINVLVTQRHTLSGRQLQKNTCIYVEN